MPARGLPGHELAPRRGQCCCRPAVPVRRAVRGPLACRAQKTAYQPPSSATAANELDSLSQFTTVVPDTVLSQEIVRVEEPKAATVSSGVLAGIVSNPAGLQEYKAAIEHAITYDRCTALQGPSKVACMMDKATVNIGSLFAQQVEGRVSTEVDPRLAHDTGAILKRAKNILALYKDMKVPLDRILVRLPATWAAIQAAKQLESEGIATHIILVYSFVQAVAAAQAGVSVIQPNIGRLGDWYQSNPGVIRDPKGPREDTGYRDDVNPGVALAGRVYNYCQKHHSKTKVMVSGIRRKADALSLAGVDYLVVGPRVLSELATAPTMVGYNSGLTADEAGDVERRLSPEMAQEATFTEDELRSVTQQLFQDGMTQAGLSLLEEGVSGLMSDVERLEPFFTGMTVGME